MRSASVWGKNAFSGGLVSHSHAGPSTTPTTTNPRQVVFATLFLPVMLLRKRVDFPPSREHSSGHCHGGRREGDNVPAVLGFLTNEPLQTVSISRWAAVRDRPRSHRKAGHTLRDARIRLSGPPRSTVRQQRQRRTGSDPAFARRPLLFVSGASCAPRG